MKTHGRFCNIDIVSVSIYLYSAFGNLRQSEGVRLATVPPLGLSNKAVEEGMWLNFWH
jgi:hypothetical protein